jgi:hypothetical protein
MADDVHTVDTYKPAPIRTLRLGGGLFAGILPDGVSVALTTLAGAPTPVDVPDDLARGASATIADMETGVDKTEQDETSDGSEAGYDPGEGFLSRGQDSDDGDV